jgi:tripartite-type tricarboxylate transporter receptor subunit TctC
MRKFLRLAVMAALLGAAARAFVPFGWAPHAFAPHALAQHDLAQHDLAPTYPNRAVKIIVSAPAGGGLDIAARVVAEQLAKMWGQPFVVENRPGAGGGLGAEAVALAEPDGYTLLAAQPAPLTTNVVLYKKLGYDPTALEPLAIMTSIPNTLVVRPDFPANWPS